LKRNRSTGGFQKPHPNQCPAKNKGHSLSYDSTDDNGQLIYVCDYCTYKTAQKAAPNN
jgi:hypothetical protein